jgi:dienelactone hydrolase
MGTGLQFTAEVTERGVTERDFTLDRETGPVPGVLWTPAGATGPRPLVAFGHGGTQNKRAPNIVAMARRLVRHHAYAAVAIDLPGHGDRMPADLPVAELRKLLGRMMFGEGANATVDLGVGDWQVVLDAVQALDDVGDGPLGYWGVSMGTHYGVPLVNRDPRITAAVLGLFGVATSPSLEGYDDEARGVTVPVLFLWQWDDELFDRQAGFTLFDLIGSAHKTLHANPGRHVEIPLEEWDHAEAFFARHLGPVPSVATTA